MIHDIRTFIDGLRNGNDELNQFIFKLVFLTFVYLGSIFTIQFVWSVSSISNALMVIPNIIMLYKLGNEIE